MIKTILIICIAAAAIIIGCQNDDSTVAPTTTNENHSPYTPNSPNPADNATGVSTRVTLSWKGGDPDEGDTTRYDIYWGTTPNTGNLGVSNTLSTIHDLGIVGANTVIYWRVVAKDNHGLTTDGPVWRFTTGLN